MYKYSSWAYATGEAAMMSALVNNGPVAVSMAVYVCHAFPHCVFVTICAGTAIFSTTSRAFISVTGEEQRST